MLYDNSQLARVYLHAWQVTGNEFFRTITEEILDYVVREMMYVGAGANDQQFRRTPKLPSYASGIAFYSTQDADSEGEEGKFFVWTPDEIRELLDSEPDEFIAAYGVTGHGNASTVSAHGFEGKNILEFVGDINQRATLAEARQLPSSAADPIGGTAAVPLLQDLELVDGQAAAYVCRSLACQPPVTTPEALEGLLCVN
jgi:uncharacterized protein YyaL (SSP411 family)